MHSYKILSVINFLPNMTRCIACLPILHVPNPLGASSLNRSIRATNRIKDANFRTKVHAIFKIALLLGIFIYRFPI